MCYMYYSVMYLIIYEIFQVDYPEKLGKRCHFLWIFNLKYFIEYEMHHRICIALMFMVTDYNFQADK